MILPKKYNDLNYIILSDFHNIFDVTESESKIINKHRFPIKAV